MMVCWRQATIIWLTVHLRQVVSILQSIRVSRVNLLLLVLVCGQPSSPEQCMTCLLAWILLCDLRMKNQSCIAAPPRFVKTACTSWVVGTGTRQCSEISLPVRTTNFRAKERELSSLCHVTGHTVGPPVPHDSFDETWEGSQCAERWRARFDSQQVSGAVGTPFQRCWQEVLVSFFAARVRISEA